MSAPEPPWLKSYQMAWEGRIFDPDLPLWMRVYITAMARAEPNLHANFQPGELARLLGKDKNGKLQPLDRSNLRAAIKKAVQKGWLDSKSNARCIVLPASDVACNLAAKWKPCPVCTGESSKPRRSRSRPKASIERESRGTSTNAQVTASGVVSESPQTRSLRHHISPQSWSLGHPTTPGSRDIFHIGAGDKKLAERGKQLADSGKHVPVSPADSAEMLEPA